MFRVIKNVIRGRLLRHAGPIAMIFAITYNCQCKCVNCSAGKHKKVNTPELSTEEAKRVIEESQKLGISILAFTGGEPLLRQDIFELISFVTIYNNRGLLVAPINYLNNLNYRNTEFF